jgi:hypothetical protein
MRQESCRRSSTVVRRRVAWAPPVRGLRGVRVKQDSEGTRRSQRWFSTRASWPSPALSRRVLGMHVPRDQRLVCSARRFLHERVSPCLVGGCSPGCACLWPSSSCGSRRSNPHRRVSGLPDLPGEVCEVGLSGPIRVRDRRRGNPGRVLLLLSLRRFLGATLLMFIPTGTVTTHVINHHSGADSVAAPDPSSVGSGRGFGKLARRLDSSVREVPSVGNSRSPSRRVSHG